MNLEESSTFTRHLSCLDLAHRFWPTFVGFSYNDSFLIPCNANAILVCFILLALLGYTQTLLVTSARVKVLSGLILLSYFLGRHRNYWVYVSLCHWVEGRETQGFTETFVRLDRSVCQGK